MKSKSRWMMAADFHLGGSIRSNMHITKEDFRKALQSMENTLIGASITYMVIAGDIFDSYKVTGVEIEAWREFVEFCAENGIYILYIPGNHEVTSMIEGTALPSAISPYAKNISDGVYEIEGYKIQGFPEMAPESVKDYLHKAEECDLLVMHAPFKHLFGLEQVCPVNMDDIPDKVKNVLSGHIHKPDKTMRSNSGAVFSPGSLHAMKLNEMENNGGVWITDDPADPNSWHWHKIFEQPLRTYIIRNDIASQDIQQHITGLKPIGENSAPYTIHLRYYPEAKSDALSLMRNIKRPDIRFIHSMISEEKNDEGVEIDETWKEENLFDKQAVENAFLTEIQEESEDLKEFLYPYLHEDLKGAKNKLRTWLYEEVGVNETSI